SIETTGIETLFYVGGRSLRVDRRRLVVPIPDDLANVGRKTIAAFEYALENRRFDLVFRTNCSSYVDLPNLRAYAEGYARLRRFYAGVLGGAAGGVPFASGSGYFLSRDLVELVVQEQADWDHTKLDDVALGTLLARSGVHAESAPRQ